MAQRRSSRGSNLRPELAASFLVDCTAPASSVPDPTDFSDSDLSSDSDDNDPSYIWRRADSVPEGIDASSHLSLGSRKSRSAVSGLSISSLSTDGPSGQSSASKTGSEPSMTDGSGPVAVSPGTDIHSLTQGVDIFSFDYEQASGNSTRAGLSRRPSVMTINSSREPSTRNLDDPNELAAHVASNVRKIFESKCSEGLRSAKRESKMDTLAPFQSKEVVLGKLLGSGEFSHAFEIKSFALKSVVRNGWKDYGGDANSGEGERQEHVLLSDTKSGSSADRTLSGFEVKARSNMKSKEQHQETNVTTCRYALKHLRPTLLDKYETLDYAQAASDLAMEAEFLGRLVHPNIIKIRGVSAAGVEGFRNGPRGYFIIIDRLSETLDSRIRRWRKKRKKGLRHNIKMLARRHSSAEDKTSGGGGGTPNKEREKEAGFADDQVWVGLQISSAMQYLHGKDVIFRDLKPQNVGFDVRGDVKIFDFGLATFMPRNGDSYEDRYEMSGAGSPRYMAPEVLKDPPEKYNLKADVYTFGTVLWEILALEQPYGHVTSRDELVDYVVNQKGRPQIIPRWPEPMKEVIRLSFEDDMDLRPTIQTFYNMLRFQLIELRDGDDRNLSIRHIERRRSNKDLMTKKTGTSNLSSLDAITEEVAAVGIVGKDKGKGILSKIGIKPRYDKDGRRIRRRDIIMEKLRMSSTESADSDA